MPRVKKQAPPLQGKGEALRAEIGVRQRAEEALRASERRLQDILDNTPAVIFVKDLDLRYILVNREYERRFQLQRDQIRGKTDFDIHPHDVAEMVRANDRGPGRTPKGTRARGHGDSDGYPILEQGYSN